MTSLRAVSSPALSAAAFRSQARARLILIEIEPEVDFFRRDDMAFGIHGRLRFGAATAAIDDDVSRVHQRCQIPHDRKSGISH